MGGLRGVFKAAVLKGGGPRYRDGEGGIGLGERPLGSRSNLEGLEDVMARAVESCSRGLSMWG